MKLVHGWGINDADYTVKPRGSDGKYHSCPVYQCWASMVSRCFSVKYQENKRTYVGCQIDERWKYFMAFRVWYLKQAPKRGDQLDKDYLGNGKLYSPETCCFVSRWLNQLFCDAGSIRGEWPQGVSYDKTRNKYEAHMGYKGKNHLGRFDTPEEASAVYLKAKAAHVEELLIESPQPPRLAAAVRRKMRELIEREQRLW